MHCDWANVVGWVFAVGGEGKNVFLRLRQMRARDTIQLPFLASLLDMYRFAPLRDD
jgi:hypothetical protein